jgi:glutathione peroxidase
MDIHGQKNVSLKQHMGKVLLIVNVASFWGATPQYLTLNALYHRFSNLEIIATPCNQFGLQEPGRNATEIYNSLKYVRPGNGFEPSFPLFEKLDVNGENEHALYTFLKSRCPPPTKSFSSKDRLFYSPMHANDLRWNFEKFLVNCNGEPVTRYALGFSPEHMIEDIQHLIDRCSADQQM